MEKRMTFESKEILVVNLITRGYSVLNRRILDGRERGWHVTETGHATKIWEATLEGNVDAEDGAHYIEERCSSEGKWETFHCHM